MNERTCQGCKRWGLPEGETLRSDDLYECKGLYGIAGVTINANGPDHMRMVSDAVANIITPCDFGCNRWEAKE